MLSIPLRNMRLLTLIAFLITGNVFSQLGFCEGSKGDPIFHEDFGPGSGSGAPLAPGITSYTYVTGDPEDGEYTISSHTGRGNGSWHSYLPQNTISNGKALIVNAGFTSGQFYRTEVSGLCESTSYEFSAFLMNVYDAGSVDVCPGTGIPVNVRFEIWDETDSFKLAEGSTGDIAGTNNPYWDQYALTFRSQPGQNTVILKMFNNGDGGCGNDLAIDDIIFRSCGDLTEISSANNQSGELVACPVDVPITVDLTATPDNSVYTSHAFQWQQSQDRQNWQDIAGENGQNYTSPPLSTTTFFRTKVAEDPVNLSNNRCSSASEAFEVIVVETPAAPVSSGDKEVCEGEMIPELKVQVAADEEVNWYDASTGGELLKSNSAVFVPEEQGIYYAEPVKSNYQCAPGPRTAVELKIYPSPQVQDENLQLCANGQLQLDAGHGNYIYNWSSGESSRQITIRQPGNYSVEITNASGCSAVKNFEVNAVDVAEISEVISEGTTVIIEPANSGEFEYSLDGMNFQISNRFGNISGGIYTAYMRDLTQCATVAEEFPHIVVPEFITPNNDGLHDAFQLKGVEFFYSSEIRIYDRYGKILAAGNGAGFSWNGTYNGKPLPTDDYWYHIMIDSFEPIKGHFTLKR